MRTTGDVYYIFYCIIIYMNGNEPTKTIVKVGKYKFQIIDTILFARGEIYCRNIKIGGINYADCVNVSIRYNDDQPVSAYIPHIQYHEECSIDISLDRGSGSIIMIKTVLDYIHKNLPTITEVSFEDMSNIECATEIEIQKKGSKNIKKGTNIYPIPLYFFSIAFNGETWYEKNFNARQKDLNKHSMYRAKIIDVLYSDKTKPDFMTFIKQAQPPMELLDELEKYYTSSTTLGQFFQSIPKADRCRLVRDWIDAFMSYYLSDVFDNKNWIIELSNEIKYSGGNSRRKYYCPKGKILRNRTYKNYGICQTEI